METRFHYPRHRQVIHVEFWLTESQTQDIGDSYPRDPITWADVARAVMFLETTTEAGRLFQNDAALFYLRDLSKYPKGVEYTEMAWVKFEYGYLR